MWRGALQWRNQRTIAACSKGMPAGRVAQAGAEGFLRRGSENSWIEEKKSALAVA